jgi:hypothetical protein
LLDAQKSSALHNLDVTVSLMFFSNAVDGATTLVLPLYSSIRGQVTTKIDPNRLVGVKQACFVMDSLVGHHNEGEIVQWWRYTEEYLSKQQVKSGFSEQATQSNHRTHVRSRCGADAMSIHCDGSSENKRPSSLVKTSTRTNPNPAHSKLFVAPLVAVRGNSA